MSTYQPKSETITYGEYQATKTKEITSQIFKRDDISTILGNISTPEQSLSNNINFSKILPVKVLPPINEESFNSNQIETSNININTISDTNLDLNTFETNIAEPNTDFDINTLQPSPTLESIQTSETENITFGMKPDRRILLVVEAVVVQVTDKVWKPIHHLPEDLQGLNVCEVLISRGDESAKDTPCKCCLDIF